MAYIHELEEWPRFVWDLDALTMPLASVRHRQGRLLGRMESLGFELSSEATLVTLTNEVVTSSAIEGEHLDRAEGQARPAQASLRLHSSSASASSRATEDGSRGLHLS